MDLKCGDGRLLIEVRRASTDPPTRIILGLDSDREILRRTSDLLRAESIRQDIRLFTAYITNLDPSAVGHALTSKHLPTTYNVIFALDALPPTLSDRAAALRTSASRLAIGDGRWVVTYRDAHGTLGEIAGAVRFDGHNNVHHRTSFMLKAEWVRAEAAFGDLAVRAGLRVLEMRRVGFHGGDSGLWEDQSAPVDTLALGNLTQANTDAEGNPLTAFKNQVKQDLTEAHDDGIMSAYFEDVLVGACLVAVLAL